MKNLASVLILSYLLPLRNNIFGVGAGFLIVLMGLLAFFKNMPGGMDVHHLTVFFTIFVIVAVLEPV